MNYKKIYDCLIEKRKNIEPLKKQKDTQVHHIIPKCCGGGNEPENLVRLTLREHYIAHLLLPKIYTYGEYHFKLMCALQRMGNSKEHNFYRYNSRLYEICVKERNRLVGENCKIINKGKTIYRHKDTGECRILPVNSKEVKSGEWIGIRNGVKDPRCGRRNYVLAIDKNGKTVKITKEEFDANRDKYSGVNSGKKGLFDHINLVIKSKTWYERLLFSNPYNTKIRKNNSNIFLDKNIFIIYDIIIKEVNRVKAKNGKHLNWKNIKDDFANNNISLKHVNHTFERVLHYILKENWNPYKDSNFIKFLETYNKILGGSKNENH